MRPDLNPKKRKEQEQEIAARLKRDSISAATYKHGPATVPPQQQNTILPSVGAVSPINRLTDNQYTAALRDYFSPYNQTKRYYEGVESDVFGKGAEAAATGKNPYRPGTALHDTFQWGKTGVPTYAAMSALKQLETGNAAKGINDPAVAGAALGDAWNQFADAYSRGEAWKPFEYDSYWKRNQGKDYSFAGGKQGEVHEYGLAYESILGAEATEKNRAGSRLDTIETIQEGNYGALSDAFIDEMIGKIDAYVADTGAEMEYGSVYDPEELYGEYDWYRKLRGNYVMGEANSADDLYAYAVAMHPEKANEWTRDTFGPTGDPAVIAQINQEVNSWFNGEYNTFRQNKLDEMAGNRKVAQSYLDGLRKEKADRAALLQFSKKYATGNSAIDYASLVDVDEQGTDIVDKLLYINLFADKRNSGNWNDEDNAWVQPIADLFGGHLAYNDYSAEGYHLMSDDDRALVNKVWDATHDPIMTQAVLDAMQSKLRYRNTLYERDLAAYRADELGVIADIGSVGTNFYAGMKGAANTIAGLLGDADAADPNSGAWSEQRAVENLRGYRGDQAYNRWGYAGRLGYNAVTALGDEAMKAGAGLLLGGGALPQQIISGIQGLSGGTYDALKNGYNIYQAAGKGVLDSAVEALTENVNLFEPASQSIKPIANWLSNIAGEGGEEIASELLSSIGGELYADILGKQSSNDRAYIEYRSAGMSHEEAIAAMNAANAEQVMQSGLIGGFVGGALSAGPSIQLGVSQRKTGKAIAAQGNAQSMINLAAQLPTDTEAHQLAVTLQEQTKNGGKISNAQLGRLFQATAAHLDEESKAVVSNTAADAIAEAMVAKGEDEEPARAAAPVLAKQLLGEKLTLSDRWTLTATAYGLDMMEELNRRDGGGAVPEVNADEGRVAKMLVNEGSSRRTANRVAPAIAKMARGESLTRQEQNLVDNVPTAQAVIDKLGKEAVAREWVQTATNKAKEATNADYRKQAQLAAMFKPSAAKSIGKAARAAESLVSKDHVAEGKKDMGVGVRSTDGKPSAAGEFMRFEVQDGVMKAVVKGADGKETMHNYTALEYKSRDIATIAAYAAQNSGGNAELANVMLQTYSGGDAQTHIGQMETAFRAGYDSSAVDAKTITRFSGDAKLAYQIGQKQAQAAEAKRLENIGKVKLGKGSVSFEGGEMPSGLTKQQRNMVAVTRAIAEETGINFTFFQSAADSAGFYTSENGSYDGATNSIRLDLRSGKNYEGDTAAYAILRTASHELTHFIEANSKENYSKLRQFISDELARKGQSFDALVQEKIDRSRAPLTRGGAIAEVVADGCEMMLKDSKAIQRLMQKDASLGEQLKNKLAEFVGRIRTAFKHIDPASTEAKALMDMRDGVLQYANELVELWDEGLVEAVENTRGSLDNSGIVVEKGTAYASPQMSVRTWNASAYVQEREAMAAQLAEATGVPAEKAKAWLNDVNSIAALVLADPLRLDYIPSEFGSTFKSNPEYGGSVDMSTLCPKRRLATGTLDAIQNRLGNVALTRDDFLRLRAMMAKRDYEVACGLCFVESSRANLSKYNKQFIDLYNIIHADQEPVTMGDLNTIDGLENVRTNRPDVYQEYEKFMNKLAQRKPKLFEKRTEYNGEILQKFKKDTSVGAKNLNGGLRLQSFSDFEIVHLIDMMQVITDMANVGLAGQAYTKVPDFAWALGDTGLKINLSLIAKGVDENGKLIFNDIEGMNHVEAKKLRDAYSENVGTIVVAFTDEQILAAMQDDFVDFIIPFHRSQWKKSDYRILGLPDGTKDYTLHQNEKMGRKRVKENYKPMAYWDFGISGKENAKKYIDMCNAEGRTPKFAKFLQKNADGTYSLKADGSTDGYWKLLIDFKMYDNDGNGSKQMPVRPEFNMGQAKRMLKAYKGGHETLPVAQDVVDDFVAEYKGTKTQYSLRAVPPVVPRSRDAEGNLMWQSGHSEQWFRDNGFPIYEDVPLEQQNINRNTETKGHGTQIASTVSTYRQLFQRLKDENPDTWQSMRVLDASSGLGLGTQAGREMGFDVTDIEPFPSKRYSPMYTDYSMLQDMVENGEVEPFDYIISNAVLNVIPQDTRDNLVAAMGSLLKPGGKMFINVISKPYAGAVNSNANLAESLATRKGAARTMEGDYTNKGNVLGRGHETFVWGSNSVQKVFSYNELSAYLQDALGDGYTVQRDKIGMTGVTVTKRGDSGRVQYALRSYSQHQVDNWSNSKRIVLYTDEQSVIAFVNETLAKGNIGKKMLFGEIGEDLANAIEAIAGVNIAGYNVALDSAEILKIKKSHGSPTTEEPRGQVPITAQDYTNIVDVITSPDDIRLSQQKYDGHISIEFVKDIGGRQTIITYVIDDKHDLRVQTMYKGKKKEGLAAVRNASALLANTPTTSRGTASDDSIHDADEKSNSFSQKSLRPPVTDSPAFREWFAGSKVVNEDGSPKLMYHGTNANDNFTVFDTYGSNFGLHGIGSYFTDDRSVAEGYTKKGRGKNPRIYEVYLNVQNPLDMDAAYQPEVWETGDKYIDAYFADAKTNADAFRALTEYCKDEEMDRWEGEEFITDHIMSKGFDGITHIGGGLYTKANPHLHRVYIVFEPDQIKSADPVTYDDEGNPIAMEDRFTSDADIRYSERTQAPATTRDYLLSMTDEDLHTDGEKDALARYRAMVDELSEKTMHLSQQQDLAQKETGDAKVAAQNRAEILAKQVDRLEAQIRGRERTNVFKPIMAEARAIVEASRLVDAGATMEEAVKKVAGRMHADSERKISTLRGELRESKNTARKLGGRLDTAERRVENLRSKLVENEQQFRERLEKFRERVREEREVRESVAASRKRIVKMVKTLDKLRRHETDYKHVPEELKPVVNALVSAFAENSSMVFDSKRAERIAAAYAKLKDLDNDLAAFYDDDIRESIEYIADLLAANRGKAMKPADYAVLENVVGNIYKMVRNGNNAFFEGQSVDFGMLADDIADSMKGRDDFRTRRGTGDKVKWLDDHVRNGNMLPVYYFDNLGNDTLKRMGYDILRGQDQYGLWARQDHMTVGDLHKKYNYQAWAKEPALEFTTKAGRKFQLTKEQALWVYATAKREASNELAATHHLDEGGFVFGKGEEQGKGKWDTHNTTPIKLSAADVKTITDTLTAEQKAYADAVVKYLSTDIGARGNDVSMRMYGYRKYREQYYFPYRTASDQRQLTSVSGGVSATDDARLKHQSFTNPLKKGANTPLVLGSFTDIAVAHMNAMNTYAAMVIPVENLNRVLNRKTDMDGTMTTIRALMAQKYGESTRDYLTTLLTDLNGGVRNESRAGLDGMISAYKKGAVMASASVFLQQATSIARVGAVMDAKYLAKTTVQKRDWDELAKWSGVATIKDMGRFDVGVGKGAAEWIGSDADEFSTWQKARQMMKPKDWETFKTRWDDALNFLPGWADRVTWCHIWNAVKAEQADLHNGMDTSSDAFMQLCAERFNDIINHTQVYDSTMTRSQMMRSKSGVDKMVTAFASEPTLILNMLYDAISNPAHKGKRKNLIARTLAGVALSQVMAAAMQAVASAWRDDDDERTAMEKFLDKFGANVFENFNLLGMFPIIRDIYDTFTSNYEVERSDMALFSEMKRAMDKLLGGKLNAWQTVEEVGGVIAKFFGVPLKNVMRDLRAGYNAITSDWSAPVAKNAAYAFVDNAWGYDESNKAYYGRLLNAVRSGDTKTAADLMTYLTVSKGAETDNVYSNVRNSFIKPLVQSGKMGMEEAVNLIDAHFPYDKGVKEAYKKVNEWLGAVGLAEGETADASGYGKLTDAMLAGNAAAYKTAQAELLKFGYTEKQISTQTSTFISTAYKNGDITWAQAEKMYKQFTGMTDANELFWQKEKLDYKGDGNWSAYKPARDALLAGDRKAFRAEKSKLLTHGKKNNGVTDAVGELKDELIALYETDPTAARKLRSDIVWAYMECGKTKESANKIIDGWFK